ncbi:hypothetical protein MTO96_001852 [Rhipicephalus appendiculatus]
MRSILEDDRLNAPSEVEETLKAILKWVSADAAARKGYLAEFLPLVRFVRCSVTVTDWDLFRKIRDGKTANPTHFKDWLSQLKRDFESATKTVRTDLKVDRMDSRLAHLLEAKAALLARWRGNGSIVDSAKR